MSFASEYDASITVIPSNIKNQYYLHFKGFEHDIDSNTKLYKKVWNTRDPKDGFYYQLLGTEQVNFRNNMKSTLIHGTIVPYFEVILSDRAPSKVLFAENADIQKVRNRKSKYLEYQNIKESKVSAKKSAYQALDALNTHCAQSTTLDIDWKAFQSKDQKVAPGMLKGHMESLTKICSIDSDYKDAVNAIRSIKLSPAETTGAHSVEIKNNVLTITLDQETPNIPDSSYKLIYNAL